MSKSARALADLLAAAGRYYKPGFDVHAWMLRHAGYDEAETAIIRAAFAYGEALHEEKRR
jgi:hypothetical protein